MKKMKLNIQLFGHTNETDNYDLPQFVGTDKPTWLGDFNTAMASIDSAIAENASDISSLDTRVTSAEGTASQASSDVASLQSTVSSLSSSVTSATTTANNAQSTATSALNTANTADGKADTNASAISSLTPRVTQCEADIANINLDNHATYTTSNMNHTGTYTINSGSVVNLAYNEDGSLAKIYGVVLAQSMTAQGNITIQTPLRPESDIEFAGCADAYIYKYGSPLAVYSLRQQSYTLSTTGLLTIPMGKTGSSDATYVSLHACLLFIKDFGDTPVVGE